MGERASRDATKSIVEQRKQIFAVDIRIARIQENVSSAHTFLEKLGYRCYMKRSYERQRLDAGDAGVHINRVASNTS